MERDLGEERLSRGADSEEAVTPAMLARLALVGGERREVSLVLELLASIVGARVTGDLARPIEHAHERLGCDDGEHLAHMRVRDGVIVSVEADVRGFAGGDRSHEIGGRRMLGQRKQASALLGERIADDAFVEVGGDEPGALNAIDPRVELGVEVVDGSEGSGGEEGFAKVAHAPLDASFLVAARDGAGLWCEVVVTGQLENAWMKANKLAFALEHGALEIVVEDGARHATEGRERVEVTA